jgi:SnoaL-like domain
MNEQVWIEKLAIQELCARYCHTIDSQDSAGWARCFTADGVFEVDGSAIRGFEALRDYAEVHARVMRTRHLTLNHLYKVEGELATGISTTVVTLATEGGYKIFGTSAYRDKLVKQGGEWLFHTRSLKTDRLVDNPQKAINLADPDVAVLVHHLVEAAQRLGKNG